MSAPGGRRAPAPGLAQALTTASLLGLASLALGAWLSFPRAAAESAAPPLRAVLLDASASATRRASGWGAWARAELAAQARAAEEAGEELAVWSYADGVRRLYGPAQPGPWRARVEGRRGEPLHLLHAPEEELGSDLFAALGTVERALHAGPRPAARVVLLAQDSFTGADPSARLAGLAAEARVEWRAPPAPDRADLALDALRLPAAVEEGAPLACAVELRLALGAEPGPPRARLELGLHSADGVRRLERELAPPAPAPGAREVRWSELVPLGPAPAGPLRVAARARLLPEGRAPGDVCPEDDARAAGLRATGARAVLAVTSARRRAELAAWTSGAGRWPGLAWRVVGPEEVGALADGHDLLVSCDLPLAALPEELVLAHLRAGGGWLHCAAWPFLGARPDEPVARLAALRPTEPEGDERDLVFLVDGSGSMAGAPFEAVRAAVAALLEAASGREHLVLRFFTAGLREPVSLAGGDARARRASLMALLAQEVPGGQTAVLDSLEGWVRRRPPGARPALLLLLTDGRDTHAYDVAARAARLRADLQGLGVRLVVIGVGDELDRGLLSALAGGEEELRVARELGDLHELFQREVQRERVREGEALPVRPAPAARASSLAAAVELLDAQRAARAEPWPPAARFVRCEAAPDAATVWTGPDGEPLLALRREGPGLVATWASAPVVGWSPRWSAADDLLGPLLRLLASGRAGEPSPRLRAEAGRLELEGAPAEWPALVRADLVAGPREERARARVELAPPFAGAGRDPRGRRVGPAPPRAVLESAAWAVLRDPTDGALLGVCALERGAPAELAPDPPRVRLGEAPTNPARPEGVAPPRPHPAAPACLAAGLALLAGAAVARSLARA